MTYAADDLERRDSARLMMAKQFSPGAIFARRCIPDTAAADTVIPPSRNGRIGHVQQCVPWRALPPESHCQDPGGGPLARYLQGRRMRLDVGAFDVGLRGTANSLGITFRQHFKRSPSVEKSVASRQPLTDAAGREGFPKNQNNLAQFAQSFIVTGPNCRGFLPVANRPHRSSRSFRYRRLSQPVVAKAPHNLSSLNGSIQVLRNLCSGSHRKISLAGATPARLDGRRSFVSLAALSSISSSYFAASELCGQSHTSAIARTTIGTPSATFTDRSPPTSGSGRLLWGRSRGCGVGRRCGGSSGRLFSGCR